MESAPAPSPFTKIRPARAHERIVEQLQRLILGGRLAPDARLPSERALMAEFQVSRPTVREALRVAESMGLISIRHGDPAGPKVLATPSIGITRVFDGLLEAGRTSPLDLLEMRITLDSSAAALASLQPKERLKPAAKLLDQMRETSDPQTLAALDAQFHEAVIVAAGNHLFQIIFQALSEPIRTLIEGSLAAANRKDTIGQHEQILTAIQSGQPRKAARAARTHLWAVYSPGLAPQDRKRIKSFAQLL